MFRSTIHLSVATALLSVAVSLSVTSAAAAGPCADPRGNAYCTNNGLVNMQNPNPPTNVNVQNPNPPTNVNVQNPNPPQNVDVQNPNAKDSGAQNPNAPISMAGGNQLNALNQVGAPGNAIVVTGQGFGSNNLMFLNVIDANGTEWDTDSRAFSCNETEDWVVSIYQDFGLGCTSGAQAGRLHKSNPDGTFSGVVQIPPMAATGPARLCAKGVFSTTCTPITISAN